MDEKTPGEVIEEYIQIRDGRRILAKSIKERDDQMKEAMTRIEEWLKAKASELGLDSFKGKNGTAYIEQQDKYGVADWDEFLTFIAAEIVDTLRDAELIEVDQVKDTVSLIRTHGPWGFFKKDVPQAAMAEYMTETETVPPGVKHTKLVVAQVRRPKTK